MARKLIPSELLTEKQKKDRKYRQQNKKYSRKYSRFYYLKKILEDPGYNKRRYRLKKTLLTTTDKGNDKGLKEDQKINNGRGMP